MKIERDVENLERQRYKEIKKSGEYLELKVLIAAKDDNYGGHSGKLPVITMSMRSCGEDEISCLYMVLKHLMENLKEEYPAECLVAEIGTYINDMGTVTTDIKDDEEDK